MLNSNQDSDSNDSDLGNLLKYRFRNHPLFEPALTNEIQDYISLDYIRFAKLKEYYGDDNFYGYNPTADVKTQFRYVLDKYEEDHFYSSDIDDLIDLVYKFAELYDDADKKEDLGPVLVIFIITNDFPDHIREALFRILDEWGYVIPDSISFMT
jgi:hypothetical protein